MQAEKQFLLDDLKAQVKAAPAFIITAYSRQPANAAYEYRQRLLKVDGHLEVVRKRVFAKAAEQAGCPLTGELEGHIGVVFAHGDFAETSKVVCAAAGEGDSHVRVLGGWYEGRLYGAADIQKIATLPSMPEMRAQLLGVFEAPMAELLAVCEALLSSVPHCLQNKAEQSAD
jgi:large subunit ribosomal protein L10